MRRYIHLLIIPCGEAQTQPWSIKSVFLIEVWFLPKADAPAKMTRLLSNVPDWVLNEVGASRVECCILWDLTLAGMARLRARVFTDQPFENGRKAKERERPKRPDTLCHTNLVFHRNHACDILPGESHRNKPWTSTTLVFVTSFDGVLSHVRSQASGLSCFSSFVTEWTFLGKNSGASSSFLMLTYCVTFYFIKDFWTASNTPLFVSKPLSSPTYLTTAVCDVPRCYFLLKGFVVGKIMNFQDWQHPQAIWLSVN